jgi:hypothetical protein
MKFAQDAGKRSPVVLLGWDSLNVSANIHRLTKQTPPIPKNYLFCQDRTKTLLVLLQN